MGTFHAFCARVLREHGHALGLPQRFTICDASDQLSAVKSAMRELRVHETTMHPSAVLARISLAKNRMETPESFLESGSGGRDQLVGSVWQRYREYLARTRALDFDDLLLETVRLLREHDERGRALPEALPPRPRGRVPGHEPPAVRDRPRDRRTSTATSAWWATTTSRSTAGAGPTSARSSASTATSRAPRSSASRRTTARPGRSSTRPTPSSATTPRATTRRSSRRGARGRTCASRS